MSNLRRAVGTLLTGLAFLGCGPATDKAANSGANPSAGATNGGSSGEGDGGTPVEGGANNQEPGNGTSAGTGATSGGTSGTGGEDSQGYIGVLQIIRTVTPPASILASASFDFVEQAAWDALVPNEPCPTERYGACKLTKCPAKAEMSPNVPTPSSDRLHAGTITMTADMGSFSKTGRPANADHGYSFIETGSLIGEELVTISATGGSVPAFTEKIQMPLAPLLLMPSLDGSEGAVNVPVPRAAGFTFSWDARDASETLQILVVYPTGATGLPLLSCKFDALAGTATFQSGALSQLPAGTRVRLFGVRTVDVETTQGAVGILAAFEMVSADKASFPTFVLE